MDLSELIVPIASILASEGVDFGHRTEIFIVPGPWQGCHGQLAARISAEERQEGTVVVIVFVCLSSEEEEQIGLEDVDDIKVVRRQSVAIDLLKVLQPVNLPMVISFDRDVDEIKLIDFHLDDSSSIATDRPASEVFSEAVHAHESGNFTLAARGFSACLVLKHSVTDAAFNLASTLQFVGYPMLSVGYLELILLAKPEDATVHTFLWYLAQSPDSRKAALRVYRTLAASGDLMAKHKLATLTNEGTEATHGDPNYARKIFDAMANVFEDRLVSVLKYNAPYLLEEEITKIIEADSPRILPPLGSYRILDLGCGSGLCAKAFHRYVSYSVDQGDNACDLESARDILSYVVASEGPVFVGIDVSEKMIDLCKESRLYSHAMCVSLQDTLDATSGSCNSETVTKWPFDLILAADTFVYVGALGNVFQAVRDCLRVGGLFAFSVEALESGLAPPDILSIFNESYPELDPPGSLGGWGCYLQETSRYGHSDDYVKILSHRYQFAILSRVETRLRQEVDRGIKGLLYVLRKI